MLVETINREKRECQQVCHINLRCDMSVLGSLFVSAEPKWHKKTPQKTNILLNVLVRYSSFEKVISLLKLPQGLLQVAVQENSLHQSVCIHP